MSGALPRVWTKDEIAADVELAIAAFRAERLSETSELYEKAYATIRPAVAAIVPHLGVIAANAISTSDLASILNSDEAIAVLRYVAAPPISADDLRTLAEVNLVSVRAGNPEHLEKVRSTIALIIDRYRFPWVAEGRDHSAEELDAAILATSAMIATQAVGTARRSSANTGQEQAVKDVLKSSGFEEVARRHIGHIGDAPQPGQYCPESTLGPTRGDVIITLRDRRLMPIECKASNSAVNSYKRLNHEALGKAVKWRDAFGKAHVLPAVVLSGVFSPGNVAAAQEAGVTILWQHRLDDLAEFVNAAHP